MDEAELSVDDVESVEPDLVADGFFGLAVTFPLDFVDCWRKFIRESKLTENADRPHNKTYKTTNERTYIECINNFGSIQYA